ncbi:MAG: hypothetical protein DMF64_15990 [Acidobacteria bacterium]|nr:MAG: hypothetical protein DMF64_15990 [Acidobacteriota bacterium]
MTPELITAIAGLWKLASVLAFLISMIIFRRPLIGLFERVTKLQLKRGATELATEMLAAKIEKTAEVKALPESEAQTETKLIAGTQVTETTEKSSEIKPDDTNTHFTAMIDAAWKTHSLSDMEDAFNKLHEATGDEEEKLSNQAFYYYLRYELSDTSALIKLQELANIDKAAPYANHFLAFCYQTAGDYYKARVFFELAAEQYGRKGSTKENQRIRCIIYAADSLFKINLRKEAYSKIMSELTKTDDQMLIADLYVGLASLYEQAGESNLRAIALEKAIEHKPNDVGLRFSAGLTYGKETATHAISMLHYKTLLQFNGKHAAALNNIGVQYERLEMLMKAAQAYKQSASLNETLAAANLANRYINAGFAEEARKLLDDAKQQQKIDPKVGEEISRLAKKEEEEAEAEKTQMNAAREQQRFFLSFAEAYFVETTDSQDFTGTWIYADGVRMTIVQTGNSIKADWIHDGLEEGFDGIISNRAAEIKFEHRWTTSFKSDRYGYAYLSTDRNELHVLAFGKTIAGLPIHTIETLRRNVDTSQS